MLIHAFAAAEPRRAGVPMVEATLRLGWTVEQHLARQAAELPAAPGMGSVDERLALTAASHRFLAGCLSFLEQRIVRSVERPASRAARRRLEREQLVAIPASAVKVIELRRREYYPKSNAHKPRYIAPYVKGLADKPLKAPAGSVFAVTR